MQAELAALGFEALITLLAAVSFAMLWMRQQRPPFAGWAAAWSFYAVRLGCISAFIVWRDDRWLFGHQAATGLTAMCMLFAALQYSHGLKWRWRYLAWGVLPVTVAALLTFGVRNQMVAGTVAVALLSTVTVWTGVVFWRRRAEAGGWALALAVTFGLWGVHHLDYPLLRPLGTGVLWGVYVDVLLIVAVTMMTMFMVLSEGRRALEIRMQQMEQLTHLLLRAQEEERRRIARELHDEAGQALTAAKIELDLEGRHEASALVMRALSQVRDLSNLIRPSVLDDLGLLPALRSLADDFSERTGIAVHVDAEESASAIPPELQVVVYRVAQEALTNVARHARAGSARVTLRSSGASLRLDIEDDGVGVNGPLRPNLGLLGMRERVAGAGGTLSLGGAAEGGFRVEAELPLGSTP
jgi:signal transduction histidine kinase